MQFENVSPLCVDLGTYMIKAGFAGDDAPRAVFPTILGTWDVPQKPQFAPKDFYVGDEAHAKRHVLNMHYPIENGIIHDSKHLRVLLHHICYNELGV